MLHPYLRFLKILGLRVSMFVSLCNIGEKRDDSLSSKILKTGFLNVSFVLNLFEVP